MSTAERLRTEGLKEGELKKSREMAKKLLRLNMDKKKIIEVTDLSVEEIEEIEKDMQ